MAIRPIFQPIVTRDVEPPARIERLLEDAEATLGATITVHDRAAIFHAADGASLMAERWRTHRHPFCRLRRATTPAFDRACLDHCLRRVNRRAAHSEEPFAHRCWKGAREVVVPLHHRGIHVATLFAGCHRLASDAVGRAGLPDDVVAAHGALAIADRRRVDVLARALCALGDALLAEVERARTGGSPASDRAAVIRMFLHYRAHQPIGIHDLARELGVSASRAGHAVKELFGQPFRDVLLAERLSRARALLVGSPYTVAAIAEKVGFASQYYFNRVFAKTDGIPPGEYRRRNRSAGAQVTRR